MSLVVDLLLSAFHCISISLRGVPLNNSGIVDFSRWAPVKLSSVFNDRLTFRAVFAKPSPFLADCSCLEELSVDCWYPSNSSDNVDNRRTYRANRLFVGERRCSNANRHTVTQLPSIISPNSDALNLSLNDLSKLNRSCRYLSGFLCRFMPR